MSTSSSYKVCTADCTDHSRANPAQANDAAGKGRASFKLLETVPIVAALVPVLEEMYTPSRTSRAAFKKESKGWHRLDHLAADCITGRMQPDGERFVVALHAQGFLSSLM